MSGRIFIATAGWNIPRAHADRFPAAGSHLARYAQRFGAVEINSSFYKPHRPATYARWAETVPDGFRFAVKVPRQITHVRRLAEADDLLDRFLAEVSQLGAKLGPLLVQLPPSLPFRVETAARFFRALRDRYGREVVCEPRHPSWFTREAEHLLIDLHIARAATDPAPTASAAEPGGWPGLAYYRLHGSPKMYYSAYPPDCLAALSRRLADLSDRGTPAWCVFDNTALGAATGDALTVLGLLEAQGAAR